MTELEYMVSKGKIHDSYGICGAAYVCKYGVDNCKNVLCSQCEFNGNVQLCLEVLLAEHKDIIKLTRAEKTILENINKNYKWIARDYNGTLTVFEEKPFKDKDDGFFIAKGYCAAISVFNHLFKFIKWENDEPVNIKELLESCEVTEE